MSLKRGLCCVQRVYDTYFKRTLDSRAAADSPPIPLPTIIASKPIGTSSILNSKMQQKHSYFYYLASDVKYYCFTCTYFVSDVRCAHFDREPVPSKACKWRTNKSYKEFSHNTIIIHVKFKKIKYLLDRVDGENRWATSFKEHKIESHYGDHANNSKTDHVYQESNLKTTSFRQRNKPKYE